MTTVFSGNSRSARSKKWVSESGWSCIKPFIATPVDAFVTGPDRSLRAVAALAALDLPAGPELVDALRTVWDRGDAVFPLDPRLPGPDPSSRARVHAPGDGDRRGRRAALDRRRARARGRRRRPGGRDQRLDREAEGRRADPRGDRGPRPRRSTSAWRSIPRATAGWPACRSPTWAASAWCSGRWSTASASTWSAARTRPPWPSAPAELGSTLTSLVPTALDRHRCVGLPVDRARRRGRPGGAAGQRRADLRAHRVGRRGGLLAGRPAPRRRGAGGRRRGAAARARPCCAATGTAPTRARADGWLPTGDLGELRADGLVVRGRRDEMIVSGGENVWPTAVEAVLDRHPAVREAAVLGRADEEWGHRVVALVVPADPARPPTLEALRAAVREELPAAAAPASSSWWTGSPAPRSASSCGSRSPGARGCVAPSGRGRCSRAGPASRSRGRSAGSSRRRRC